MRTTARRDRHRLLLVLALIAGVLSMHALVVAGHEAHVGLDETGHHSTAELRAPLMAAEHVTVDPLMLGNQAHPGHHAPAAPADAAHGLLHLCLAVLAAIAVLLLSLSWLTTPAAPLSSWLRLRRPDPAPARPPPRSAVRLALLCVLRN